MTNTPFSNQHIPNDWIQQWQAEVVAWKEMLKSRIEKNVWLKNKITDILKYNYHQDCLDEIEEFQTKSIRKDEIISILRMEVAEVDKLLHSKNIELQKSIEKTMIHLRNDMATSEDRFVSLISAFKDFQQKICTEKAN